ncbi:MAG: hypothetical protein AB1555_02550 [Nitrospirota bacterium]
MRRSPARHLTAILATVLLSGCAASVVHLRETSALIDKIRARRDLAEPFARCTAQAYRGQPAGPAAGTGAPQPAGEAAGTFADSIALTAAVEDSPMLKSDEDVGTLLVLVREMADPAERKIDLNRLARLVELARRLHARLRIDEDRLAEDTALFARLLLAYNKAYFGDIRFQAAPSPAGDSIRGVSKVTSSGFVDRNGNAFVFPGLSSEAEFSPKADRPVRFRAGEVESRRVVSDLVRVFLEALFDAAFRVPAEQNATAVTVTWGDPPRAYPKFDADHPPIALDRFARVSRDALRAEAAVTSVVGKAVRGAGVFGTNNETLAAALETAAGVTAKKLAEHELFCYFLVTGASGQP